ncbi:MAG: TatD family hydrolase [Eubacterium sp.]
MIFDTHAHYDDEAFDEDRENLLDSMKSRGIGYIVNVGANIQSSKETIGLTKRFPFVYGALGVHPNDSKELIIEENCNWLRNSLTKSKIVAVGEIGLDYYWDEPSKEIQKEGFVKQLNMAREVSLPVIIHSRDAAADTLDIVKAERAGEIGGVVHCFSYGVDMAREYLDMGFYLGIGGVVTFKNGRKMKEVVEYAPLNRIVIETDCPYLSPEPNRGKRNSSLNLPYVVNEIAAIKNISPKEVINATTANAKKLYFGA